MADCILAGDIGGTKTRLGIFSRGKNCRPLLCYKEIYSNRNFQSLEEIIGDFLGRHRVPLGAVCLGIAGAVVKGRVKTTNLPWKVSADALSRTFSWPLVGLVNDLVATAYAVPLLQKNELFILQQGSVGSGHNIGLLAPGTGLGTALLIGCDGNYVPVPSEGGHVGFAPQEEDDIELWRFLVQQYGHVSLERIISGPGLYNIYRWLRNSGRYDEPAWLAQQMNPENAPRLIAEQGLKEIVPLCRAALEKFVVIMGAAAGDLALVGMTYGGLFLGGGIPPKILAKLREPSFIEAFNNKGRLSAMMPHFPVAVILNDQAALLGAAHCALKNLPA